METGDIIARAAVERTRIDGRTNACLFGALAAGLGDGTPAEGMRDAISRVIAHHGADACVVYGSRRVKLAQLVTIAAPGSRKPLAASIGQRGV